MNAIKAENALRENTTRNEDELNGTPKIYYDYNVTPEHLANADILARQGTNVHYISFVGVQNTKAADGGFQLNDILLSIDGTCMLDNDHEAVVDACKNRSLDFTVTVLRYTQEQPTQLITATACQFSSRAKLHCGIRSIHKLWA